MTTETSIYEYAKQGLLLSENKPALWFYGRSISYKQLFEKIDCVADQLYRFGIRCGDVVTVHLPNCPQAVMAIYAIAKLGGVCNMVHPQVPRQTLVENMQFCNSKMLITGSHFKELEAIPSNFLCVYADLSAYMGLLFKTAFRIKNKKNKCHSIDFEELVRPAKTLAPEIVQSCLANNCVAYLNSSGTTGTPKTVMHSHQSFNNWVRNAQSFFRGETLENAVVLSALPMFHGSGMVLNLHQVLCGGGAQVLLATWNAKQAARFIQKHRVTIITGVPYLFHSLLKQRRFLRNGTRYLTQCFVSGDHTPTELKERFDKVVGHRTLFEGYGMTEIVTACFSTSKYDPDIEASGYPLENCRVIVLDEEGTVKCSGCGEFLVNTNTMMLGYLGEDMDSRVIQRDGILWFRTGDYGEIDERGYLFFRERLKNIIIRNGYNIYPREIEEIIRHIDVVNEVCVIGNDVGAKGEDVIAFIETESECTEEIEALAKKQCNERLPKYALPTKIVVLNKFPRNQMKKVDRQALRAMIY